MPGTLRAWWATAALAYRAWPAGTVARVLVALANDLTRQLLPALALGRVVDHAARGDAAGAGGWMVLLGAALLTAVPMWHLWDHFQTGGMERTAQAATRAAMVASTAPAGIEHLESAEFADRMETVRTQAHTLAGLFDHLAVVTTQVVGLVAAAAVLAAIHPLLVIAVATAVGLGSTQAGTRRRALAYMDTAIPGQRLAARLVELGTAAGPAREVRTLGLAPWLATRHRALTDEVAATIVAAERRPLAVAVAGAAGQAGLLATSVALVVAEAAAGRATAGDVATGIVLLKSMMSSASFLGQTLGSDLAGKTHVARRYLSLLDYRSPVARPTDPCPVPSRLRDGIVFDRVGFTYPGSTAPAVHDVSLTLPAGSTVALVGDNGAGKSTLVKLLCRFYDPDAGCVTIDGIDLRDLDPVAWRAGTTGACQDFVRFHLRAQESVGVGFVAAVHDAELVSAAARAGGAAPFLEALVDGYGTQLGPQFPGGVDLSEGQWQKVALSRGLMRVAPLLVLLDEPTAALDARAEHLLFERYTAEAAAARDRGAVTVLVSHRFSTVKMADLIVVLDRGRVVETGTHTALLAAGGHYADLYHLQADRYR